MNVHWRKSTNQREGKPGKNFDVAFGTDLRITVVIVFKEASMIFLLLWNKAGCV
jgi:hypothetical protein